LSFAVFGVDVDAVSILLLLFFLSGGLIDALTLSIEGCRMEKVDSRAMLAFSLIVICTPLSTHALDVGPHAICNTSRPRTLTIS